GGQVFALAARQMQFQRALDQLLRQVARTEAVGRKLFAGEVDEPDVAAESAAAAQVEQDRGGQHEGGGGGVVVVGATGGQAGAAAAILLFVAVGHVGGVVVVGHDDRPAAVPAGDHDQDVALGRPVLVVQPAAHPG